MTTIHDTLDGLPALIRWEHARDLGLTRHETGLANTETRERT